MTTVNNYIQTNYYVQQIASEEASTLKNLRASNWERINRGERPEPLPPSQLRNKNEIITTTDVTVSCIAQAALMLISLAITATFVAFSPQASLAAIPSNIKGGVIEGVLLFAFNSLKSLLGLPEDAESPPLLQDWHDHFTQLAAYTPDGRMKYYKSSLKSIAVNALYTGVGTYFWSPTFAADQLVSGTVRTLTSATINKAVSFGSQRFYPPKS